MSVTAIILAGGKSTRMGTDKGLVNYNQKPMIAHIINTLQKTNISDIIIIAHNAEYEKFGYPVYQDIIKDKGPLGGIYTGLLKSKTSSNLILSCDIPLISHAVLNHLLAVKVSCPIVICKYKEQQHHLIGLYSSSLLLSLTQHLQQNSLKVRQFIEAHPHKIIDMEKAFINFDEKQVQNINSMQELKQIEK